ncbi:MAG TPA: hypothetical protein VJL86_09280 [Steroidobacteraceae bacterium]|nr:hypothetical protein [Steroidobacteraceae bacterium]
MAESDKFSLTNCGPVDRALARVGLPSGDPPRLFVRAFLPAVLVWVPLLVLELVKPPIEGGAAVSFFDDLSTHVRFLLVVPLLVLVEASIGRRTKQVASHFVEARLVSAADRPRFDALLRKAGRAFESAPVEAVIAGLAACFVWSAVQNFRGDGLQFWFEEMTPEGARLSAAGWWYVIGSWLSSFLLLRWFWRYVVWCWFLQRLSRLDLQVLATHPDQSAGLGFVSFGHTAFAQLGFTVSCLVAGAIATRVLHEGASLLSYQWPLAAFVAISIALGLAPLAVFWRPLRMAKEAAVLVYGSFASKYIQDFHARWIGTQAGETPLESSGDVQGLADIGGSLDRVYDMRLLPISLKTAIAYAVAALAPMLPLLLLVMPLRDLLRLLMQAMI